MQCQQVGRLAGIEVNHSPHGTCIANLPSVFVQQSKVTIREKAIHILHPSPDGKVLILKRHFIQFDSKAGENPCVVVFIQCSYTESTIAGMKTGAIQQMVSQHAHGKTPSKVHMERFRYKLIFSYLTTILTHYFAPFLFSSDISFHGQQDIRSHARSNWW